MARLPLVHRLLRQQTAPSADATASAPAPPVSAAPLPASPTSTPPAPARRARRTPTPPPGELRRERRALLALREERLRDLGGLALEMYRRDRFREDLVLERCAELIGLEARIHELDVLLGSSRGFRRRRRTARCECGAPLLWHSRFCANCGRPIAPQVPGARPQGGGGSHAGGGTTAGGGAP